MPLCQQKPAESFLAILIIPETLPQIISVLLFKLLDDSVPPPFNSSI